jgi:hypothetical protein
MGIFFVLWFYFMVRHRKHFCSAAGFQNLRSGDKYLRAMGLIFNAQFFGNQMQIKVQEKLMIYGYFFGNGTLPRIF